MPLTLPPPTETTSAFGVGIPARYTPPAQVFGTMQAPAVDTGVVASIAPGLPAPTPVAAAPATTTAKRPAPNPVAGPAAAMSAGIQAGQLGASAYDTKSGAVAALGAGASGALAGGMVAGVPGAIVGGVTGLGIGALQAWLSVGEKNRAKRDQRKLLAEAKAQQKIRDDLARSDGIDQLAFDRDAIAEAKAAEKWALMKNQIVEARSRVKARRDEFVEKGYVT